MAKKSWYIEEENNMPRLTEEEAQRLDTLWTETTPELESGKGGPFTKRRDLLKSLDTVTANYIITIAVAQHKTPAQIIGDWAREKMAYTN
jgi:hypothetical protein